MHMTKKAQSALFEQRVYDGKSSEGVSAGYFVATLDVDGRESGNSSASLLV